MLVAVGAGDEVDGAGAGGLLGGARVGAGRDVVGAAVGCGAGCADDGCAAPWAGRDACPAAARVAPGEPPTVRGWCPEGVALGEGVWDGVSAAGADLPGAVVSLFAAGAAVRANRIANPTVASAPI